MNEEVNLIKERIESLCEKNGGCYYKSLDTGGFYFPVISFLFSFWVCFNRFWCPRMRARSVTVLDRYPGPNLEEPKKAR